MCGPETNLTAHLYYLLSPYRILYNFAAEDAPFLLLQIERLMALDENRTSSGRGIRKKAIIEKHEKGSFKSRFL